MIGVIPLGGWMLCVTGVELNWHHEANGGAAFA
jgi:hypothetical protein